MLDEKATAELNVKTNVDLIDHVLEDIFATPAERLLAERLQGAVEELDRLTQELQKVEALNGANA